MRTIGAAAAQVAFRSNNEVAIHVPDLERAEAFYAGVMGFQILAKTEACLELESGTLRLYVNRDPEALRAYIPSFDVPDLDAAKAHLKTAGCTTIALPSGGVYFQDPFGFAFDLIERALPTG